MRGGIPSSSASFTGLILIAGLAPFLVTSDFSMIGIVLPRVGLDLKLGTAALSGLVSVYALAYASLLMVGGRLADLWGLRRCLLLGLVLFAAATALVVLAPDLPVLLTGRGLQGVAAALISPACLSLMNSAVPEGALRVRAYRVFGSLQGASSIAGPVIGGALATRFGWRAAYVMELGLAVALVAAARAVVPVIPAAASRTRFDWAGAVLIALAVISVVAAASGIGGISMNALQREGAAGVAVLSILALLAVERRSEAPLLPPALLRNRRLGLVAVGLLSAMAAATGLFLLPNIQMQQLMGWTAAASGLGMLPHAVLGILGGQVVGLLMSRYTLRLNILLAFFLLIAALLLYAWLPQPLTYLRALFLPMAIGGIWSLVLMVMLMAESSSVVSPGEQGVASGLAYTATQIGTAISSGILLTAVGSAPPGALASGLRMAYLLAAGMAVVGVACAAALPSRTAQRAPA